MTPAMDQDEGPRLLQMIGFAAIVVAIVVLVFVAVGFVIGKLLL